MTQYNAMQYKAINWMHFNYWDDEKEWTAHQTTMQW